jgi:crotonobetainyl-CoA:carnitine CoA-transferase CaiB-like acyl-CoA transferase
MKIEMTHKKLNRKIEIIGNPIKFSESKIKYKKSPPSLGEDTEKILSKFLKLSKKQIQNLKEKKII